VITVQVAEQVGLRGVLITSGKEAVLDAVEEGKRMDRLFRKVTHHAGFLEQAYNSLPFPFVLLNGNGDITEHNKKFNEEKTLLNIEEHNLSHLAKQVLETGKNQWDQLETEGKLYDLQAFPVSEEAAVVGMIIQPAPFVPGKKALSIISSPAHLPIIGDSRFTRELRKAIRQYAETGMSICITGEPGTGKRTIAQAIHFEKFGKDAPIIEVRGKSVSPDELAELQTKLSFVKKGTVLISNTDELNETAQIALSVLLDNKPEEMKVICLSGRPIEILVHKEKFDSELYEKITVHSLHCPPLRERKDDISAFVTYFIAELHTEAGNEILGMKQEAVQYLEELDWKGNLTQLRQVIRELSFMTSVYYIELGHVQDLMRNFQTSEHPKESDGLPLTGTLKEMEHKIIKQVMEEEGNNQTKAAKRLGINRSTLWRKLNDTE
jgi:transcriptional regulator with PAS, ATPase and Fis domain